MFMQTQRRLQIIYISSKKGLQSIMQTQKGLQTIFMQNFKMGVANNMYENPEGVAIRSILRRVANIDSANSKKGLEIMFMQALKGGGKYYLCKLRRCCKHYLCKILRRICKQYLRKLWEVFANAVFLYTRKRVYSKQ